MGTNPYLQWFNDTAEQALYDDLYVEHIKNHGHDVLYLPRTGINKDELVNEFTISEFNTALPIEVYVKNFDSFEGEGELLSKFGLEIRDQMTLSMSIRSFNEFIKPTTTNERPFEGDCIYIPMLGVVYQIKYVNSSAVFYTLGKLNTYDIVLELLEFSNEVFNTGVAEIDNKYKAFQNAANNDYDLEEYDNAADNVTIQTVSDDVLDFTEMDPFSAGNV